MQHSALSSINLYDVNDRMFNTLISMRFSRNAYIGDITSYNFILLLNHLPHHTAHSYMNERWIKDKQFSFFFFFWNENSWAQFKFIDSLNSHFKNRMNKKRMKKIITSVFVLCVHHLHTKCIRYFFFHQFVCVCCFVLKRLNVGVTCLTINEYIKKSLSLITITTATYHTSIALCEQKNLRIMIT